MLSTIVTAIIIFAATNIDDILILMLLFTIEDNKAKPASIVLGQYFGFSVLVIASLIGYFSGALISPQIIGLLGLAPIIIGISKFKSGRKRIIDDDEIKLTKYLSAKNKAKPMLISTMLITIANGGDNIGIYIPLFSRLNAFQLAITLLVFMILVAIWCIIGYRLIKQKHIGIVLTRYGNKIVPLVLVGLGIMILIQSESYKLLNIIN